MSANTVQSTGQTWIPSYQASIDSRRPAHVQPGTGSTGQTGQLSYCWEPSAAGRHTAEPSSQDHVHNMQCSHTNTTEQYSCQGFSPACGSQRTLLQRSAPHLNFIVGRSHCTLGTADFGSLARLPHFPTNRAGPRGQLEFRNFVYVQYSGKAQSASAKGYHHAIARVLICNMYLGSRSCAIGGVVKRKIRSSHRLSLLIISNADQRPSLSSESSFHRVERLLSK